MRPLLVVRQRFQVPGVERAAEIGALVGSLPCAVIAALFPKRCRCLLRDRDRDREYGGGRPAAVIKIGYLLFLVSHR